MFDTAQSWEIFGYDTRQIGRHWVAAWRDLVWADNSPIRAHLDDVVQLRSGNDTFLYQSGEVCAQAPFECEAILLPDELMLSRRLRLPIAAEGHLDAALAMEVAANSPFASEDTAHGWKLVSRDQSHLSVIVSIVSISTVMTYLGKQYDIHDPFAQEVWVEVDGGMMQINGFGEARRASKYRKRLVRCGLGLGLCLLLILLTVGAATAAKRVELLQLEEISMQMKAAASEASRMRLSLAVANETVTAVNEVVASYPNPHVELARLTNLLDDEVSLTRFSIQGREIRIQGRAVNAASVMQLLTDEPGYSQVSAPQAITKVGNSGLEQFSLDIKLAEGVSG